MYNNVWCINVWQRLRHFPFISYDTLDKNDNSIKEKVFGLEYPRHYEPVPELIDVNKKRPI